MERIAIYVDKHYHTAICQQHRKALEILNQVAAGYNGLSAGELTTEKLQKILDGDFTEIRASIRSNVEANIRRAKFDNQSIIEIVTERAYFQLDQFVSRCTELKEKFTQTWFPASTQYSAVPVHIENFTVKDGMVHFTEADQDRIRDEFCTVWIDTPLKHEIHSALTTVIETLNKIRSSLTVNGINTPLFFKDRFPGFLIEDDGEISLNGEVFDFK